LVSFLLGEDDTPFLLQGFTESWVMSIEEGFNFHSGANKFTARPINVGVEGAEPRVAKNHSIRSKVSNIKAFTALLCSIGYKKVKVVCYLPQFVKGSINVP